MSQFLSQRILEQQQSAIRKYSAWVQRIGGVNLSQGVCDQPAPEELKQAAKRAIDEDKAIYTHMQGIDSVRQAVAEKLRAYNNITADPETEIAITIGSAGSMDASIARKSAQSSCVTFVGRCSEARSMKPRVKHLSSRFSSMDRTNGSPISLLGMDRRRARMVSGFRNPGSTLPSD